MPMSPGGVLNPLAVMPFCPDQTDFLTFRTPDGFGAVYLDLVEAFQTCGDGKMTGVCLTNQVWYESVESVPELVARFAAVKKLRYSHERQETETQGQALTTRPVPAVTDGSSADKPPQTPPVLPTRPTVWKNP